MTRHRTSKRRRGGVLPPGTFAPFQAMRERELARKREREARSRQEAIELDAIRRAWPRLPSDLREVVLAIVGQFDGQDILGVD